MPRVLTCLALLARFAAAADYDWIQTARVFLIDAYEPPFAVKLEYDAKALAETMAGVNANTVRIATMGKYALIPGVRFTPHPELGNRDVLAETIAACKPRGIRVVPYISTGHKLAWTMVTRDHPEYAQRTRPGGGPARSHMFVGEDHGTVCWNTPYRQAYLDLVERVVRDYDIDGIYFDTWRAGYFWPRPGVCYCDGCRNGFRKATGMELPWQENEADYTRVELAAIDRYHAWNQDVLVETLREVRRVVKSHKNIPLIYNINNPVKINTEDPRVLEAVDAFLYERGNSILERAEGVSLARAAGLGVWPYVGEYNNWPRMVYNQADFQQQIFTTVMFGGAPILALPWGYVQHAANRRFAEYPFGVLKQHEREFAGFKNYPYAAVVYGYRTPPGHAQSGTWWKTDARLSSLGAFAACLYGHVQVSSVHENILDDPAKLAAYRILYLADIAHLSEARIGNIKRFVREGGGLVASYATSLFDSAGKRQGRFGLEELFRAAPVEPTGDLAETLASYHSMTGGPYDLYLAPRPRPSLDELAPLWSFEPVKALEGGEVWRDVVTGDGLRPILPGVIVSQYGKGHVVYCASALESLFLQANNSAAGDLVRSLVAKAAPEPPPYEIAAPAALIANLTAKGDTVVLHMTNWTGNKFERAGANEDYLAGVENVRVRFAVPEGKRVRDVRLLVDAPYRKEQKGGTLEVFIPRVEAYQAVRVDWQAAAAAAIHSDFEGGSIGPVEQVAPRHFRCGVKGEVDQEKRNRQASWYYFRVDAASGAELTIDLTDLLGEYNYKPGNLAINGATRPFISYDRKTWAALPAGALEWDAAEPRLRMRFVPSRSPVWIAHAPPYTTEDLNRLLADSKGNRNLEVEQAGKSAGGHPLWLLTVTNPARPAGGKKVLWLMARQHAWESGTSWVVDGAVRFLLGDDARAARLRDAFIFKFFPMADPDGVVRGGVRFNVHGYDVNRNWDTADPKLMPEIAALRKTVLGWVDGGGRIDLFLSLHNTNSDYLQGPLTSAGPPYRKMIESFAALLARDTIFAGKAPRDWPPGKVERGRMDACQGLFHDRAIPTLLIEQNVQTNARLGRPAGVEDYTRFGAQLARALAAAAKERGE